ncbi:MAG: PAS domain S-box protein, partial [Deltaproteobacteria bacterium]|nr:PAS domain S-box protein [Deltaproteobacteria bacterium]
QDHDEDSIRRCRLLVASILVIFVFAQFFLYKIYTFEGFMSPTAWVFVCGSALMLLNLPLLHWTRSPRFPSTLFIGELIVSFGLMAYCNGGYDAAALIWNLTIPLLATVLVGPKFGLLCAGLIIAETIVFYVLTQAGYPFPRPLTAAQDGWFHVFGSINLILFIALVGWLYEALRKNALARLEQARQNLEQDIMERQRVKEALRDSEHRYRSVVESAPEVIFTMNTEGILTSLNPAFETFTGWAREQFLGQPFAPLLHPDDLPHAMEYLRQLVAGEVLPLFELRLVHQQGQIVIGELTVTGQTRNGHLTHILGVARDITHRKEVERLKNELLSTVSHELRTPLASLRGFTELMLERDFPLAQRREFLTIIQKESLRLTNLINDFLDLERSASGRQVYHFDQVALAPLLQETLAVIGAQSTRHPCHLELPATLPPVQGDATRLRQVVLNLLTNAIKYSPRGGAIRVGARLDKLKVVLWVADQGMGIPPDARTNLFQKFYRVDNAETRRIGGTGLGLALVKEIVQAHGGEVWVESVVGLGSTFFFSLPVPEETSSQTLAQPSADRNQSAANMENGETDSARCQQESPNHREDSRQPNDRGLGCQSLPSGT